MFAGAFIPRGAPVLKIDDSRIVTDDNPLDESKGEYERHCDYLAGGTLTLMQPPERYINHSCNPNTFVKSLYGIRHIFALRDIPAGAEITYDYCINGSGDTVWECRCGSARCRQRIHSDFFHLPHDLQLEYLTLLDDWYLQEHKDEVQQLLASAGRT